MPDLNRREQGLQAETAARQHLEAQGCQILLQNFTCRMGELDLVALDSGTLAIIEVRQRAPTRFASAAESVTPRKQKRIVRATRYLLLSRPQLNQFSLRFDVVALDALVPNQTSQPVWIKDAFQASS